MKELVARLPCVLCEKLGQEQRARTHVHHIRSGQGLSQRAGHYLVVALCGECHTGVDGIHGTRALLRIANCTELDLLDMTIERVIALVKKGDI